MKYLINQGFSSHFTLKSIVTINQFPSLILNTVHNGLVQLLLYIKGRAATV